MEVSSSLCRQRHGGEEIVAFETAVRKYCGARFAVGVSSGTAGLHLCVRTAGIGPGELVITTPFSFVASANVLLFENAVPIFVDVDPQTGNIDADQVQKAAADLMSGSIAAQKWLPRSGVAQGATLKALLPVDVFGQPADMDPIMETARKYGLTVIERRPPLPEAAAKPS